jgi:DNA-binding GntR family transcriptional regulator
MKRAFAVPEITLNLFTAGRSLRRQIEMQVASGIRGGRLPHGTRLPSSRMMARLLKVSRGTVVDAYEALLERGLLVAKAGSGVRVNYAAANNVPNFTNLRRTASAAHYPIQTLHFVDPDGTMLYFNVAR